MVDRAIEWLPLERHWSERQWRRRVDPVVAQTGNEGLRVPVAERRMIDQPLTDRCPACRLDHVGLEPSLVQKHEPFQMPGHDGLAVSLPDPALLGHIRPGLLSGAQVFFYD